MTEEIQVVFVPSPPFESSNLRDMWYSSEREELRVEFKTGDLYAYFNVPAEVWARLEQGINAGESVGKLFNELVKKAGYEYAKLAVEEPEGKPLIVKGMEVRLSMLWFDNNKDITLQARIMRAVNYFMQKYNALPHQQFSVGINPADLPEKREGDFWITEGTGYSSQVNIFVYVDEYVLPNHFMVSEGHIYA